jgi:hypothetical protein
MTIQIPAKCPRRAAFFDSYLTNLIERDVKELAVIERRSDLRHLLALLAGRTGSLLVAATLATESGIPRTTLNRYLELLSAVFPPGRQAGHTGPSARQNWHLPTPESHPTFSARTPPASANRTARPDR